jgi:hypothetical protein
MNWRAAGPSSSLAAAPSTLPPGAGESPARTLEAVRNRTPATCSQYFNAAIPRLSQGRPAESMDVRRRPCRRPSRRAIARTPGNARANAGQHSTFGAMSRATPLSSRANPAEPTLSLLLLRHRPGTGTAANRSGPLQTAAVEDDAGTTRVCGLLDTAPSRLSTCEAARRPGPVWHAIRSRALTHGLRTRASASSTRSWR